MSNIGSYKNTPFTEQQKFVVLDPATGSTSLVLGSSLIDYITPKLNYVRAETTRTATANTDYEIGTVIQTIGAISVGDGLGAVYLVVEGGTGDFPMLNGNDLLIVTGDDNLRADLISTDAGKGASLVSMEGGPSVEVALTQAESDILDRVIRVSSRTEMKAYDVGEGYQFSLEEGGVIGTFVFRSGDQSANVTADTKEIFWVAPDSDATGASGAYERVFKGKFVPIEWAGGAAGDSSASVRTANEEALAAIEAFDYQPLLNSGSDYYFSAGYDLWQHRFVAGRDVSAFIDATEYNVSNAIWGIYRIDDFGAGTNNYITLRNSRDDIVIARIARGDESAASHVFQLPLDIRRDSHSLISQAGTAGGSSDFLFRNSDNDDLTYIVNDTANKKLQFTYNTTVPPSFNFDEAFSIPTETTTEYIQFPTLPVNFAAAEFTNPRSGLALVNNPGGNRVLGVTKSFPELPYADEIIRSDVGGFTYYTASGVVEFSVMSSGGVSGRRRQRFEWSWNGATASLTLFDEANTLPAAFTATAATLSGNRFGISMDFDETAGIGSGCQMSAKIDFSYSAT